MSNFWTTQPPLNTLNVFVKVRRVGEQRHVAMNAFTQHCHCFFHASEPLFLFANRFRATIAAVDNEEIREPFKVDVPSTAKICEFQDIIHDGLRRNALVGSNFETTLDILPLAEVPSVTHLQAKLTQLRHQAQAPSGLPNERASDFFGPQNSDGVHFLVWLPDSNLSGFH